MRALYAVHFEFADQTEVRSVVDCIARWPDRGAAPREVATDWSAGRKEYPMPRDGHSLTVDTTLIEDSVLWECVWSHPHVEDENLTMVNQLVACDDSGSVTASLTIGSEWNRQTIAVPKFSMRAPRLSRELTSRFEICDAGVRLQSTPREITAGDVDRFVEFLFDQNRTRPVILVSDYPYSPNPLVDAKALASELAGVAHVAYTTYGNPARVISKRLGRLGCHSGAMRIWWPGLKRDSNPYANQLFLPQHLMREKLRNRDPVVRLFRQISIASVTTAPPAAHADVRRRARRARVDALKDFQEFQAFAEELMDDNDRLQERLAAAEQQAEQAVLEREIALEDLNEAEEEKRAQAKSFAESFASEKSENTDDFAAVQAEPPKTVLEAVQTAMPLCPHLSFADRALESAGESPFEFPDEVLDDLLKLEKVAALWARPEGIGGTDLAGKAKELGLTWRSGVSGIAASGTRKSQYEFSWRGEKRQLGPHTRRDHGSGAGKIVRIYFDKYEPEDPAERLFIVGHVGKKLDDTTT